MSTPHKSVAKDKTVKPNAAEKAEQEKKDKRQHEELKAKSANSALFSSAVLTKEFGKSTYGEIELNLLYEEVKASTQAIQEGNLDGLEAMLVGQAKALQSMFVSLARRANNQEYMKNMTTYMSLALKAQSQSRATIQALVELKYPRQLIVTQQANITHGNQQVNNGVATQSEFSDQYAHTRTHAGKNQTESNELMESNHANNQTIDNQPQRLDTRAAQSPITSDSTMETVATVNRRKNT